MRAQRMAVFVIAATLAAAGCGGGSPADPGPSQPPAEQFGTVRGTVSAAGAPVAGASLQLTAAGAAPRTATSAANGNYQFNQVAPGSWSIAITPPAGYTVQGAATATVTVAANQIVTTDFTLAAPAPPPPGEVVEITMQDNVFNPNEVTVPVNTTVRWRNAGGVEHNSTGAGGLWASPNLAPGATFQRTFSQAGEFDYVCTLHAGMTGTVRVQ
jgi:plastocyanin